MKIFYKIERKCPCYIYPDRFMTKTGRQKMFQNIIMSEEFECEECGRSEFMRLESKLKEE